MQTPSHIRTNDVFHPPSSGMASTVTTPGTVSSLNVSPHNTLGMNAAVAASSSSLALPLDEQWQSLAYKTLPLFNGQGLQGSIEQLNEYLTRSIEQRPLPHVLADFRELLQAGMLTLRAKLSGVSDEQLVSRMIEVWTFFFGTVLPYIQGVCMPLQQALQKHGNASVNSGTLGVHTSHAMLATNAKYGSVRSPAPAMSVSLSAINWQSSNAPTSSNGAPVSHSMRASAAQIDEVTPWESLEYATPQPLAAKVAMAAAVSATLSIKSMTLVSFRNVVVMPLMDRLEEIFEGMFAEYDSGRRVYDSAMRLVQMLSVLYSVLTDDEAQKRVENGLRSLERQLLRHGRAQLLGSKSSFVSL